MVKTRIFIRESSFKLPLSVETPLLMICTGTGIAPYISFLQEHHHNKHARNMETHHSYLIFGSKNRNYDYIYEDELNQHLGNNILHKLTTAFSRDQVIYNYLIVRIKNTMFKMC